MRLVSESFTYRHLASLGLLGFFLLPLAMKDAHLLLETHEHPQCEAQDGERHLHSEEYQHHDCALCLFCYAQFLESGQLKPNFSAPAPPVKQLKPVALLFVIPTFFRVRKRGPPLRHC